MCWSIHGWQHRVEYYRCRSESLLCWEPKPVGSSLLVKLSSADISLSSLWGLFNFIVSVFLKYLCCVTSSELEFWFDDSCFTLLPQHLNQGQWAALPSSQLTWTQSYQWLAASFSQVVEASDIFRSSRNQRNSSEVVASSIFKSRRILQVWSEIEASSIFKSRRIQQVWSEIEASSIFKSRTNQQIWSEIVASSIFKSRKTSRSDQR